MPNPVSATSIARPRLPAGAGDERDPNRFTSGKLFKIAQALDGPVSFFYDELPEGMALRPSAPPTDASDGRMMIKRETLEFVRAYYRIKDPAVRRQMNELVRSVAGPTPGAKKRGPPPGSGRKAMDTAAAPG